MDSFTTCPYRFEQEKLLKAVPPQPLGDVQAWGLDCHKALEERCRDAAPLPERMQRLEPVAQMVLSLPGEKRFESHLAVHRTYYNPIEADPDKTVKPDERWCHGFIDVLALNPITATGYVMDYKFGKVRPTRQMHLYAALVFSNFPAVQYVKTALVYLKTGEEQMVKKDFTREKDHYAIWDSFLPAVARLEAALDNGIFVKKPSGLCGWCPVVECDFWRERK